MDKPNSKPCLGDTRRPRFLAGLRRSIFGIQFLPLMTQPPGIKEPSTTNRGTQNSGTIILISKPTEVVNAIDMALSSAPLLSSGMKAMANSPRKVSR